MQADGPALMPAVKLTVAAARPPGRTRAAPPPGTSSRVPARCCSTAAPACSPGCGRRTPGRRSTRSCSPTSTSTTAATSCRGSGDRTTWRGPAPGRPGRGSCSRPAGRDLLERFGALFGTPEMFERAFTIEELRAGQPVRRRRLHRHGGPGAALRRSRPTRCESRRQADVLDLLGRHRRPATSSSSSRAAPTCSLCEATLRSGAAIGRAPPRPSLARRGGGALRTLGREAAPRHAPALRPAEARAARARPRRPRRGARKLAGSATEDNQRVPRARSLTRWSRLRAGLVVAFCCLAVLGWQGVSTLGRANPDRRRRAHRLREVPRRARARARERRRTTSTRRRRSSTWRRSPCNRSRAARRRSAIELAVELDHPGSLAGR